MAAIAHAFTEQNSNQTSTGSYADITGASIASGSFTAGKKYLIEVTAQIGLSGITDTGGLRVAHGGTAFADSESQINSDIASSRTTYHWFTVWTAVSSEAITLQASRTSGTTDTVNIDQISMTAMNLSDDVTENTDWFFAEDGTDSGLTSTWVDGASITFTPGTAGHDWLVKTITRIDPTVVNEAMITRIDRSGEATSSLPQAGHEPQSSASTGWMHYVDRVFNLGASSNTFKEQSSSSTNDHTRLYSAIFAINLNEFRNHANAYTEADVSLGTSNYAVELQTISITPAVAGDVLIGAFWGFDRNSAAAEAEFRVQYDNGDQPAAQTTDNYQFSTGNDATDEEALSLITLLSATAAAHTIDLDGSADISTATPAGQYRSLWAFTMELPAAGGGAAIKQFMHHYKTMAAA